MRLAKPNKYHNTKIKRRNEKRKKRISIAFFVMLINQSAKTQLLNWAIIYYAHKMQVFWPFA